MRKWKKELQIMSYNTTKIKNLGIDNKGGIIHRKKKLEKAYELKQKNK